MDSTPHSGMEVLPDTGPQVAHHNADKFFDRAEGSSHVSSSQPSSPQAQLDRKPSLHKACWTLAVVTVLCMTVALGAGLGAGLAIRRKSNPTNVVAEIPSPHSTSANAVTRLTGVTAATPAPVTQTTTFLAVTTATPAPATPTTASSARCPAANGSTYTITNQVAPTARPYSDAMYSSIAYMILCDANYQAESVIIDLQALSNITSLGDCLNACALYSFQTPPYEFVNHSCSGLAWESEDLVCWLKSNVSLSSQSEPSDPTTDGAVLIPS
ncbi:hypothetical protein BDR22DRAFT_823245 [Usnea florida]